jgi:hypothetical protein
MKGFWFGIFKLCLISMTLGVCICSAVVTYKLQNPGLEAVLLFCVLQVFFLAYVIGGIRKFNRARIAVASARGFPPKGTVTIGEEKVSHKLGDD